MKQILFVLTVIFGVGSLTAQQTVELDYYLIEGIDLKDFTPSDSVLLEDALKAYYAAKDDTSRINSLNSICENMMHEVWEDYQQLQYEFILKALKNTNDEQSILVLKKALAGALNNIGYIYDDDGYNEKAITYYLKSLQLMESIGDQQGMAGALVNLGSAHQGIGKMELAIHYYFKGLRTCSEVNDTAGAATALNNIGNLYGFKGEIPKAIICYSRSLKLREAIGDINGIANSLNGLGVIYNAQGNYQKSLEVYQKSLDIATKSGDKQSMAEFMNNIAAVYEQLKETEKSLEFHYKSLQLKEQLNDNPGASMSLLNIGSLYKNQGELDTALSYYYKSLAIHQTINYKFELAYTLQNIGEILFEKGLIDGKDGALSYVEKSLAIAEAIKAPELIRNSTRILSAIYEKQGKGMKALAMHKLYIQMKDSLNNEVTQKATIRQQTQYEFEKAQIVKENESKELARIEAEATGRRNNLQYSLIFLGILVLFVAILFLGFIKVSPNLAEGLIFFAFLILFEFVLVFTEPYLENYTQGEPMYNLLANSVLALLIFPVHALLEKLLKKRIVK